MVSYKLVVLHFDAGTLISLVCYTNARLSFLVIIDCMTVDLSTFAIERDTTKINSHKLQLI